MTSIRLRGTREDNQTIHDHLAARFAIVSASPDLQRRDRHGKVFWDRYLVVGLRDEDTDDLLT